MRDPEYEYDVFISFANTDQDLVRPLWHELTQNGLRVFWSDSVLRDRVGVSWFDIIQESLSRSRHFLFICTPSALSSHCVKREYVAFFNHCYRPPSRLLVPVLAAGARFDRLPLFLKEVEACVLEEPGVLKRLIRVLGGVDVEGLQAELAMRNEELLTLKREHELLKKQFRESTSHASLPRTFQPNHDELELRALREERTRLTAKLEAAKQEQDELCAELARRYHEIVRLQRQQSL